MIPGAISNIAARTRLWLGLGILALGAFLLITKELFEGRMSRIDRAVLMAIGAMRRPWLNAWAIDVTALGSSRVLVAVVAIAVAALLVFYQGRRPSGYQGGRPSGPKSERRNGGAGRERRDILQLVIAGAGGGLLTLVTKDIIERPRPEVIPRLVEVTRSSYPSGHSLGAAAVYVTLAIVLAGHLRGRWARVTVGAVAGAVIALVALSRLYLGVHYPSDVAAGVALGAAWAFLVEGALSRRTSQR